MEVFFGTFRLTPIHTSAVADRVEGTYGHCWVRAHDPASALIKGSFKIKQYNWEIAGVEQPMMPVTSSPLKKPVF
jgi:hypothetical protein